MLSGLWLHVLQEFLTSNTSIKKNLTKMIKKISIGLLILALATSCVSKKIYTDLENKYVDLKKENRQLADHNKDLTSTKNQLDADFTKLQNDYNKLKQERDQLENQFATSDRNLKTLQASYNALEKNSEDVLGLNSSCRNSLFYNRRKQLHSIT